jgi:hypothetical protein
LLAGVLDSRINKNGGGLFMTDPAASPIFTVLKILGYVSLASMGAAMIYAAVMALRYWPGIAV